MNDVLSVYDDFLTDDECKYIIELSEPLFAPSQLMGEENYVGFGRSSRTAFLVFREDKILNDIRKRASELIKLPESHFEFFQCVSYDPGQEIQHHFDTFDERTESGRKEIESWGQRKYTLLAYLNDDFEGGNTVFPKLDLSVQPKKRSVVVFNNLDENDNVLGEAFHAGLPVITGRKYALNMWVRNKP
jgi:prolyl 4-hydroxylase